jgi:hypothetical protein
MSYVVCEYECNVPTRIPSLTARQILGTIRGLAFMHSLGLVHGNIISVPLSLSLVDHEIMKLLSSTFLSTANIMPGSRTSASCRS